MYTVQKGGNYISGVTTGSISWVGHPMFATGTSSLEVARSWLVNYDGDEICKVDTDTWEAHPVEEYGL